MARLAGRERQALRDAMVRCKAESLASLHNWSQPPRLGKLDVAELAALLLLVLVSPDPALDALWWWTLPELCRVMQKRFTKRLHPANLAHVIRRVKFLNQKACHHQPFLNAAAQKAFKKGALLRP